MPAKAEPSLRRTLQPNQHLARLLSKKVYALD
jgi:hypothetical protein